MNEWPADEFEQRLLATPRVVVVFHAAGCKPSEAFLAEAEEADAEIPVPFVVADLSDERDPRWDAHDVRVVPTVAFFDHGEELERVEATLGVGIPRRAFHAFIEHLAGLEEDERQRRKVPGWRRYRPWLERSD